MWQQSGTTEPFNTTWINSQPTLAKLADWLKIDGTANTLQYAPEDIRTTFNKREQRFLNIAEAKKLLAELRVRWDSGDMGDGKARTFSGFVRKIDGPLFQYARRKSLLNEE